MKKYIGLIITGLLPFLMQAQLVMNNSYYVVLAGGNSSTPTSLVLSNSAPSAITNNGSGWIISENEFNIVQWDIGTGTGTYTVPFGYSNTDYLPLTFNVGTAGSGNGVVKFSTYHTTALNSPSPSDVITLSDFGASNYSLNMVDRFWDVDANTGYATKPTVNLTFTYISSGAASEIATPNYIVNNSLIAQHFNSTADEWNDFQTATNTYASSGNTSSISSGLVSPANFFRSWTLANDSVLSVTTSVSSYACSGGTALATVNGGTSPYTYSWSNGEGTGSTASGLSGDTYTVSIQDNIGASATASVTITQPNALSVTAAVAAGGGCGGGGKGSATATPNGGTLPYTYSWSPGGGNSSTATGLSVGAYMVTVTDHCGGTATASANIQSLGVSTAVADNVSCYGGANGLAKAGVSGGKAPYTYSWSPVSSYGYIASGLSAGTYSVTIIDNNGCSGTSAVAITQPYQLRDSVASTTYPVCAGGTGSVTIGVKGGTLPYNYGWSPNVSTTTSASILAAHPYEVQVKDAQGCWNDIYFTISQPPALRDSIVKSATVNVSCNATNGGSAVVGVKYGTAPYTYSWSHAGGSSSTANGLIAGTYTVTVNDVGSCSVTASVTITQPVALSSSGAAVSDYVSCNGGSNGLAKVGASGGSSPYTYSWSPVTSNGYIASGLSAGTYTVTIKDKCGASLISSVTVTQPAALSDSVATKVLPPCTGGTGSATIGVTGGTSPYKYTWTPNVSSTDSAGGLTVRSYVVQVKDNKGCYNDLTVKITCTDAPIAATYKATVACCPASENINLYPNPNTGQFTLSGLQQGMILEMYDYTGKLISTMTSTNATMQLDIFNQANGVYLIRILDKDGNLISEKKVVKTQ